MRPPIAFVYGNCVFGAGPSDAWAAFALDTSTYEWLSDDGKRARFLAVLGALEAVEADLQIVRVGRRPDAARYVAGHVAALHHRSAGTRYVEQHARRLAEVAGPTPVVFMVVSLREPERDVATYVSRAAEQHPRQWWDALRRTLFNDHRLLTVAELEQLRIKADRAHALLQDFLPVRQARTVELQWLVRRAFCRGLGEPEVDGLHEPRALLFERNGEATLAPLEADVLRWMDGYVEHRGRALRIESELGTSWQAQLVLGALPERMQFPGGGTELMFTPAESLPFDADLTLNARFLPNELALRVTRRRIQDADQIVRAESEGEQGVSDLGYERTQEARDLLAHLQSARRPPLLRATIAIAIAAPDEQELEQRVESCRRAYGEVRLHRPLGDQLELFLQHLPGQRTRVAGYDDTLTSEQVAAMMPTAAHAVGSQRGFYLGCTLSGSRQAVMFSLREGSDSDRNSAVLSVGSLGSGKTTLDQKLKYEAFLLGARVVDCDPKGDHRFHLLDEVAPHAECITLGPDRALRGMLDPLRIAPEHLRHDAAVSFLCDLLPGKAELAFGARSSAPWTRSRTARANRRAWRWCGHSSTADELEAQLGRTLEIYARSGLTQLGFADPDVKLPVLGQRQVTYLPIRDLPGPMLGTRRSDYSQAERVGEQIVRLIAMFAVQLMGVDRDRLKLFSFDEGWRLLQDPAGRVLMTSLQRMGRSELAVPIISTQLVERHDARRSRVAREPGRSDVRVRHAIRCRGGRALALLGLDGEDGRLRQFLLELDSGRCLFRDHRGRIEAIQVDVVVPSLLRAFSTTPGRA